MDDRRKKGEFVGALGALLVHVAVIALLIPVSYTHLDVYKRQIDAFILSAGITANYKLSRNCFLLLNVNYIQQMCIRDSDWHYTSRPR